MDDVERRLLVNKIMQQRIAELTKINSELISSADRDGQSVNISRTSRLSRAPAPKAHSHCVEPVVTPACQKRRVVIPESGVNSRLYPGTEMLARIQCRITKIREMEQAQVCMQCVVMTTVHIPPGC